MWGRSQQGTCFGASDVVSPAASAATASRHEFKTESSNGGVFGFSHRPHLNS